MRDWQKTSSQTVWIDELEMPCRPSVPPGQSDREVWVDVMPDPDDTNDWLKVFGNVDEVLRLPSDSGIPGDKGYILFRTHAEAKACVDMGAGRWSESGRFMAARQVAGLP